MAGWLGGAGCLRDAAPCMFTPGWALGGLLVRAFSSPLQCCAVAHRAGIGLLGPGLRPSGNLTRLNNWGGALYTPKTAAASAAASCSWFTVSTTCL